MDKIALINPAYDYPVLKKRAAFRWNRIWPPLDLANSAALLENEGFKVSIIDANANRMTPKEVAKKVKKFDKVFITSGSLDRWQCPHLDIRAFLKVVEAVREVNKGETYIMGPHGTFRPKELLEITRVNGVIVGEPELTILEICKTKNLKDVRGLFRFIGKKAIFKPRKSFLNLNSLPIPSFKLLPMEKYFYELMGDHFTLLEASRGCPYSCIFCAASQMYGKNYRIKNAENVMREIEFLIENFGVKTAYFIDLEFTLKNKMNVENIKKLCNLLIEKNLDFEWCVQTRADSLTIEILKKMKQAGCRLIHFGVESGSEKILKSINKKLTLTQIERAIKLTKKVGIESVCFFIFGLPYETIKDMKKTIEFAKKINPEYASFHIATPYPNTVFYETVKNELNDVFPAYYDGIVKVENLKKIVNHAFIQFYLRPSYLIKKIIFENPRKLKQKFNLFINFLS